MGSPRRWPARGAATAPPSLSPAVNKQDYEKPLDSALTCWSLEKLVEGSGDVCSEWGSVGPPSLSPAVNKQDYEKSLDSALACWSLEKPC